MEQQQQLPNETTAVTTTTASPPKVSEIESYQALIDSIGGLIAGLITLAGIIGEIFRGINNKIHLVADVNIVKFQASLNNAKDTDMAVLSYLKDYVVPVLTYVETRPEGKKFLEQHQATADRVSEFVERETTHIENIYADQGKQASRQIAARKSRSCRERMNIRATKRQDKFSCPANNYYHFHYPHMD